MTRHLIKLFLSLSKNDVVFFCGYMWFFLFLFSKLGLYALLYFNLFVSLTPFQNLFWPLLFTRTDDDEQEEEAFADLLMMLWSTFLSILCVFVFNALLSFIRTFQKTFSVCVNSPTEYNERNLELCWPSEHVDTNFKAKRRIYF